MNKKLIENNTEEDKQLYEILAALPDEEKKQARIYLSALRDRVLVDDKKAG